mgnify:CR=1 FL=1
MNLIRYVLQDLRREKVKTFFGVAGIFVSIILLTVIGSLNDSLAYSYIDQATYEVGSADISIGKQASQDLNFNAFFDENLQEDLANITTLKNLYPRIQTLFSVLYSPENVDYSIKKLLISYGLNSTKEQKSSEMGDLKICEVSSPNPDGDRQ